MAKRQQLLHSCFTAHCTPEPASASSLLTTSLAVLAEKGGQVWLQVMRVTMEVVWVWVGFFLNSDYCRGSDMRKMQGKC